MRFRVLAMLLTGLLVLPVKGHAEAPACPVPASGADEWPVAGPSAVGLDGAILCRAAERFAAWKAANVHAILVARAGKLVFERYFTGNDEHYGEIIRDVTFTGVTLHDVRSVTKSVTALTLGVAVGRGLISGIDQSIAAWYPAYPDLLTPERSAITLRHLLTMSAGLEWDENRSYADPENSERRMNDAPDPVRFVLSRRAVDPPVRNYNYSGASALMIAGALSRATGKTIDQLADELILGPLGITDRQWYPASASGTPAAASGLRLRPRDMAKIGQLVLNRGTWKGRRVVSESWIDQSITPQIGMNSLYFYGFQWWLGRSLVGGRSVEWAAAVGLGGQRIFVIPTFDMVVVTTAGLYADPSQSWVPILILNQHALAAVAGPTGP